ncbi:MAG: nitrile hydratase subunit beta [Alphaproteobacteria bacterium]|nr:nitrile hydratase subunit beta [Alphaproteobacteria bacterium]
MSAHLHEGDQVLVREDYPIGHIRTPVYVRGKRGVVVRHFGAFGNPETLAFCLPSDKRELYKVRFRQRDLWPLYRGSDADTIELDLYEHWLEKA